MIKRINYFSCLNLILIFIYLGFFYPCAYNLMWFNLSGAVCGIIIFIIWIIIFLLKEKKLDIKIPNKTFLLVLSLSALYQIFRIIFINDENATTVLSGHLLILFAIVMCINSFNKLQLFNYIFKWHYIMLTSLIIGVFLLSIGHLPLLGEHIYEVETETYLYNYGFFFIKTRPQWLDIAGVFRPAGWYDEPGSLANVLLYLLIFNKLYFNSKKAELFFIIGGIFTFSMAHIIISSLYLILFYLKLNIKSLFIIISIITIVTIGFFWTPNNEYGQAYKKAIFDRTTKVANNTDTSRNFEDAYKAFKKYYMSGASTQELSKYYPNATKETIWFNLARNGIFGSLIYFFPILFILIKKNRKTTPTDLKLLVLLGLNFIQRPDFYFPLYFVFIYYIWYQDIKHTKKTQISRENYSYNNQSINFDYV